jgi:hypothetical protein
LEANSPVARLQNQLFRPRRVFLFAEFLPGA